MSNYSIHLISLLILVNVLGLAQGEKKLKSKYFKKFTAYYTNWKSSHPRFSDDSRYVVFSRYEDGVSCPDITRISLDRSDASWFTRLSPGFGVARNPSFAGSDSKHVIFESNIHKGPLKNHFSADENWDNKGTVKFPCDDVLLCRNAEKNETLAKLCAEPYYEIPPTMALYSVNQYGNLIAQLTGPNTESDLLQYNGGATVARDGKTVVFSGRCDTGICLYKFDYLPDDLKNTDAKRPQVTKIDTSSLNEPNAAYGGVSFSSDGDTIVFHGYTPQPNNDTALQIFRDRLDYENSDLTSKRCAKAVSDICSQHKQQEDSLYGEVTGVGDDYIEASDAAFNLDGTKLAFVINSGPHDEDGVVRSIAVGEFYLPNNTASSNLLAFQESPSESESPQATSEFYEREPDGVVHFKDEKYLKNVRQLTFGGVNRKGYFKGSGVSVIGFEAYGEPYGSDCSQISPDKTAVHPIICRRKLCDPLTLDALKDEELSGFCSGPTQEMLNDSKVFTIQEDGLIASVIKPNLLYAGEPYFGYGRYYFTYIIKINGTASANGPSIVYKSARNDTYKRVTHWQHTGYKGGPVYNGAPTYGTNQPALAFHADFSQGWENITRFHKLFRRMLIDPSRTEIYVADIDFKRSNLVVNEFTLPNTTQLTDFGCASWGPTFLVDTFQILFTSDKNYCGKQKAKGSKDSDGNEIVGAADLFVIGSDGTGLEQMEIKSFGQAREMLQSLEISTYLWQTGCIHPGSGLVPKKQLRRRQQFHRWARLIRRAQQLF
ncbi:WD40-like protein [Ditylenchus destructor]|nr:WD40-like protein [Ditylenchus destructor]